MQREKALAETDKTGRSRRQRKVPAAGIATNNQIASSMGERLRPSQDQAEAAKRAALAKKFATEAALQSRNQMDEEVYGGPGVRRHLFTGGDNDGHKGGGDGCSDEECLVSDDDDGLQYVVEDSDEEGLNHKSQQHEGCSRCAELVKAGMFCCIVQI